MKRRVFEPNTNRKGQWQYNAIVGGAWSTDWFYVVGYKEAADILVEYATSLHAIPDYLFYPICFNYRHALELTLKELIRDTEKLIRLLIRCGSLDENEARACQMERTEDYLRGTHSLESLLDRLTIRLRLVCDEMLPDEIRRTVCELHNIDPDGQVFRYARARHTQRSLSRQQHYDLRRIRDQVSKAISFLADGVGGWLDAEISNAQDYLGELDSYIED